MFYEAEQNPGRRLSIYGYKAQQIPGRRLSTCLLSTTESGGKAGTCL